MGQRLYLAGCIGLHVNTDYMEYICFHQRGDIFILKGSLLRSSVSATENDLNTLLAKAWASIDWLLVIWKSDLIDKIKRSCFQAAVMSVLL